MWKSFNDALNYLTQPTKYEMAKGIKVIHQELELNEPTFKILKRVKDDNSISVILFFTNGTNNDYWHFWVPNKHQFECLQKVIDFYKLVDYHNLNKIGNKENNEGCEIEKQK